MSISRGKDQSNKLRFTEGSHRHQLEDLKDIMWPREKEKDAERMFQYGVQKSLYSWHIPRYSSKDAQEIGGAVKRPNFLLLRIW